MRSQIDGDQVRLRSSLPADGNVLTYAFAGSVPGASMNGDRHLGEYMAEHAPALAGIQRLENGPLPRHSIIASLPAL
jgi:hypothetical protein